MYNIWIDKEIIPFLIDAVEIELKEKPSINGDSDGKEQFDPNDYVIFQSFVLPVLRETKETGFNSEQMLHKGFSFMVSLIPLYLRDYSEKVRGTLYGRLAKIYYNYTLNNASLYLNSIEEKYIEENTENINKYIDLCKIKRQEYL
jgi:hypothetical protein